MAAHLNTNLIAILKSPRPPRKGRSVFAVRVMTREGPPDDGSWVENGHANKSVRHNTARLPDFMHRGLIKVDRITRKTSFSADELFARSWRSFVFNLASDIYTLERERGTIIWSTKSGWIFKLRSDRSEILDFLSRWLYGKLNSRK